MQAQEIITILAEQRRFFEGGATLPVRARIEALKRLKATILSREKEILTALKSDLGKSAQEAYMCEVGMALFEISHMIKHVAKWAKPKRVKTPLAQFRSKSYRLPSPLGNTLIMSPWNYPFLLTIGPLANAIAAGNTAIVKPSAYSPATATIIKDILASSFSPAHVAVVTGGRAENAALLEQKFDFIFFTGSGNVGREVLRHCAEHLTPAVLELGGKSPCIVDDSAKIALAAKRIVFGKLLNCGQTCVAPDYILCDERIKDRLVAALITEIKAQYGEDPLKNPYYGKMVNQKHFDRVRALIDPSKVALGGATDEKALKIAPTVMTNVTFDDAVMGEEIFGPVLPVLTYKSFDELIVTLSPLPKPLALYVFSENKRHVKQLTERLSFGGGCVNDVIIHLATSEMGFGGVGESGMGAYHGKVGFDTFSHTKSIVDKKTWLDLPMRYQPYSKLGARLIRFFLK